MFWGDGGRAETCFANLEARKPKYASHFGHSITGTMTDSVASEVDVLRVGYRLGCFTKSQIARWADQQIAATDEPSLTLIELSMNQQLEPRALLKCFDSLGHPEAECTVLTEIGLVGLAFRTNKLTAEMAVRSLWSLVDRPGITEAQRSTIYWLDDACDLALEGIFGTMSDVARELRELIAEPTEELLRRHLQLFVLMQLPLDE